MYKRVTRILSGIAAAFLVLAFACPAHANPVTGPCANCHTMHNSQNGESVVENSSNSNLKIPVSANGPNQWLLKIDCLGCHSANNGSTSQDPVTGAPIVYNTSVPTYGNRYKDGPNQGLAGGNFYFVEHVDDNRGHNVMLGNPDDVLNRAPNNDVVSCESTTGGCHWNLNEVYTGGTKPRSIRACRAAPNAT